MKKITVIDYGCGNLLNLDRALKFLGYDVEITREGEKIINSSHVILPGVGAFGTAMKQIDKYNLRSPILNYAKKKQPLLGICLGMQILLSVSYEFGVYKGLGLIEGEVVKIENKKNKEMKIPHVGWNEIYPIEEKKWNTKILQDSLIGKSFYFVHSYIGLPKNLSSIVAVSKYYNIWCCSVRSSCWYVWWLNRNYHSS